MKDMMQIAVAANQAFAKYLYVMLTSLLENHKDRKMTVYLLSADMEEEWIARMEELAERYGQELRQIRIGRERFPEELPSNEKITLESYFRLALPELLPEELERVLYLDVDLIINKPVHAFYDMDFEGKSLAACLDVTAASARHLETSSLFAERRGEQEPWYFNAGVLLMNLSKLRKITNFAALMEQALAVKEELVYHDQDLLNYVFFRDVKYADVMQYNLAARTAFNSGYRYDWVKEHTAVLHYAGPKPWQHEEVRYELEAFWWEWAKKTPFYTELLEEMVMTEIKTGYMDSLFRNLKQENDELRAVADKCMKFLKGGIL